MKRFYSKRNTVYLKANRVYKKHSGREKAAGETAMLRALLCGGVDVPCVICLQDSTVVMEYVPGLTLPDLLERQDCGCEALASALCAWLASFYGAVDAWQNHAGPAMQEIRGDVNGRNFIISPAGDGYRVCGVDFEERCYGRRESDVGRLCAFIRRYDIESGRKMLRALSSCLLRRAADVLCMDKREILRSFKQELADMRVRRAR